MTISLDAKVSALNDFMAKFGARIASALKLPIDELNIQETDLVLAVAFDTKTNVYAFDFFGKAQFPFEQKMSDKDIFLLTDVAGYIMKANKTTGDFSKIMFPYIDKTEFSGVDAETDATEAAALEAFWGGKLNIERGSTKVMENFRVRNLQYVPEKQLADERYPTTGGEGFKLTRKPILGGKDKIKVSVEMGELSADARKLIVGNVDDKGAAAADFQNYGILVLRGFLIADAAEPHSKM